MSEHPSHSAAPPLRTLQTAPMDMHGRWERHPAGLAAFQAQALATQPRQKVRAVLPPMPAEVRVGLVGFGENERLAITTILSTKSTVATRFMEWRRELSPRPDLLLLDDQFAGVADYLRLIDPHGRIPALWVGNPSVEQFRHRAVSIFRRPMQWSKLPEMLTNVLQQRLRNTQPMPVLPNAAPIAMGLIVSDESSRGHALGALLGPHAMEYVLVPSAEAAVASARAKPFAIVLIDTLSPGIDPFKACHMLKTGAAERLAGRDPAVVLLVERVTRDARKMGEIALADAVIERDAPQAFVAATLAKLLT